MYRIDNVMIWRILVAFSREGSLKETAAALSLTQQVVSRLVAELEKELGGELFDRTVRPARPTELFHALLPAARRMVEAADEIGRIAASSLDIKRVIRLSTPANMNVQSILTAIDEVRSTHPNLRVDIYADKGLDDLTRQIVDLVVLPYKPDNWPGVHAEPLYCNVTMLLASARYLKKHPAPRTPEDLMHHKLLVTNRNWAGRPRTDYIFKGKERYCFASCPGLLRGTGSSCRQMLIEGQGIALNIDLALVSQELSRNEIVPVLPGWHFQPWDNQLCCRETDADDAVMKSLIETIHRYFYSSFADSWKFWYRHFEIPYPDLEIERP